jgi:hypothetical protein
MLDILLALVVVAIVPFVMAAMGGHLATLAIEEPSRRRLWKMAFWAICIVGVCLGGWQAVRTVKGQNDLGSELGAILKNTEKPSMPPVINVQVPKPEVEPIVFSGIPALAYPDRIETVGQPARGFVSWILHGTREAKRVHMNAAVYIMSKADHPDGVEMERFVIHDWKKRWAEQLKGHLAESPDIFPQTPIASAAQGPVVTQEQLDGIMQNRQVLFVIGTLRFFDNGGWHEAHTCGSLSYMGARNVLWQNCVDYKTQVDLQ